MSAYAAPARRAALFAAIAILAACSSDTSTAPNTPPAGKPPVQQPADTAKQPQGVARIELSGDQEVVFSYMGWLQAAPKTADGAPANVAVTWQSSDPTIVEIDAVGGMIGRKVGTVVVTARIGDVTATRSVTVVARQATTLQVTPWQWELHRGDVANIDVLVLDQHRQHIDDAPVAFSVSDPSIVQVVGRELRPLKAGAVTVTITSGNVVAKTPLRVAARTEYPLHEVNRRALPAIAFESEETLPNGRILHQLVVTEGKLSLSNSDDRFTQRLVVEEWQVSDVNGYQMRSKLATHVQESSGRYAIDATGHTVLHGDDGRSIIGTTTGTRGVEMTDYQQGGSWTFHFWR